MARWALALCVPLALACGGGGSSGSSDVGVGAPLAPEAPPAPAAAAAAPVKMAFTRWHLVWIGQDISNDLTFLPDGTISDERWPDDKNTWKVDGDKIHMTYNSNAVTYDGEYVDAWTMGGTYSTDQEKGMWKATRTP